MSVARILLLGKPTILYGGERVELSVKKAVALLAYLATTGRPHGRERLAALLWPDASDEVARTSLRMTLRAIRETPFGSVMSVNRTEIGLGPEVESDVQAFQACLDRVGTISMRPQALTLDAVTRLQQAAELYAGDFMDDFSLTGSAEWDDWQQFRRIAFQYQATQVFAALALYYADRALSDSGLRMASRWLELDPYNEDAHRLQMQLYALGGQAERALEQYHLLVRLMKREQGRQPDPQTRTLYDHARTGVLQQPPFTFQATKTVRSILPRPSPPSPVYERERTHIKRVLGVAGGGAPAPLVVVYDADGDSAGTVVAQVTHEPDVETAFPDCLLWASLDGDLDAVLRLWMDALRISVLKNTNRLEHLVWQFHNGLRGRRVLVVLERIETENQARLLAPGYPGCALLVTTRHWEVARNLASNADHLIVLNAESCTVERNAIPSGR